MYILVERALFNKVSNDWSAKVLKIMIGCAKNKKIRKYKRDSSEQSGLVHRTAQQSSRL